jgi:type IV secretory pathway TrbD component
MRILVAGLLGGIVMFIWGVAAHMLLPIGEAGMKGPVNEDTVISALRTGLPAEDGIYVLPYFDMKKSSDDAAISAFVRKSEASPYAFVVYRAQGRDSMQMGANIAMQWISDTLAALAVAIVLAFTVASFGRRVLFAGLFGAFSWLTLSVPYWNWYRFPLDFTLASLAEQVIGWLLAGVVIAWWLGRVSRATRAAGDRPVSGI